MLRLKFIHVSILMPSITPEIPGALKSTDTCIYYKVYLAINSLSHWCRVPHICISKLPTIGSNNGLSPDRCEAIILTHAGILLIGPLGMNFSEILIEVNTFSLKKMHLKISSAKRCLICLRLDVLINVEQITSFKIAYVISRLQPNDWISVIIRLFWRGMWRFISLINHVFHYADCFFRRLSEIPMIRSKIFLPHHSYHHHSFALCLFDLFCL